MNRHPTASLEIPSLSRRRLLTAATALPLAGCSARTLNALVPSSTFRFEGGIAYGEDPRHRLDVYRPLADVAGAPLAVFFYGGSWTRGDRADYRFVGEALASAGIVTVVADYRLSPQVRWREILDDCARATRWSVDAVQRLGASPSRVFLMGHSAGAYNAAMLALDARWLGAHGVQHRSLAGWVGIAGPYDFLPITDPEVQVAFDWPNTPPDSQPVAHADATAPRTLLLAAREDNLVNPQRNSEALARDLQRAGRPVRLQVLDGVNHVTLIASMATPLRMLAPVRDEVTGFLRA
ncbi:MULTISPECIES: alpha/beta hydrolase [Ramlibacter]|uniref:Alpha/beta hydrolase n=1 Tax=Ramlibacter aquaticus TaxID=2780094 RepID=A0ABR9SHI8_9BURK|nr:MULTISPECIES: alpha/beta hydrolase [Ramlibacter]MBE7941778.1 alpha/beta hydrolase [Ramlibacter aquaticus]